jgi:hypothetical protein
MTGPDLMNTLLGVLLRFMKEAFAVMADIEQMFYCFKVIPDHRKYLRFIWHEPKRVFMRSGPVINTLFNDCPQKVAEESNTPRIRSFFWGW